VCVGHSIYAKWQSIDRINVLGMGKEIVVGDNHTAAGDVLNLQIDVDVVDQLSQCCKLCKGRGGGMRGEGKVSKLQTGVSPGQRMRRMRAQSPTQRTVRSGSRAK
jgi:hypothetical protein